MNFGLRRKYAVSTMDSGHWGTSVLDGRWAYNNRLAEIDWGSRAVTETAKVTKAIIRAYYGEPQKKSYFVGCSTGGRMAALEAHRRFRRHPEWSASARLHRAGCDAFCLASAGQHGA